MEKFGKDGNIVLINKIFPIRKHCKNERDIDLLVLVDIPLITRLLKGMKINSINEKYNSREFKPVL